MKQNNITKKRIAEVFAEGFSNDPLYVHLLPDETKREAVLKLFFKLYIDLFGKGGDFLATSDDLGAIAFVYYSNRAGSRAQFYKDLWRTAIKGLELLKYMKVTQLYQMIKALTIMSSDWIEEKVGDHYIHLDLIVVKEEARGKGKAKHILSYIIDEATRENTPLTLETQNPDNVGLYEHFGFEVVRDIHFEGMVQYCMVKK